MANFHAFSPDVNTIEQEAMEVLVHEGREGQEEANEEGNLETSPATSPKLPQMELLLPHLAKGKKSINIMNFWQWSPLSFPDCPQDGQQGNSIRASDVERQGLDVNDEQGNID